MKKRFIAQLSAACLTLAASGASAATINLITTDDGLVNNYARPATPVSVSTTNPVSTLNFVSGAGNLSYLVFEFDLSSISDTDTITSASFNFALGSGRSARTLDASYLLDAYLGDGAVNVADFSAAGTQIGMGVVPGGTMPIGSTFSATLGNLTPLQSALLGNLLTVRMTIDPFQRFPTLANYNVATLGTIPPVYPLASLTINSKAAPDPDPNPSPVPLPAGLPLLLTGLVGLAAIGRKRRK